MATPRGTNGDQQDKSFGERRRAWAELEVEMMGKYGHIPLEQFKAIVSHELLSQGGGDAGLMLPSFFNPLENHSYPLSLDDRADKRAEELWYLCQQKPSVVELTAEIEKLRNEIRELSIKRSTNESTDTGWVSCLWFIFLVVIVLLLIRWII